MILEDIKYKQLLLKKIQMVKEDCQKVNQILVEYTVKEMNALEVKGKMKHFTTYDKYETLK